MMTPSELAARLRQIASAIDASERPNRARVAAELDKVITAVWPTRTKLPVSKNKISQKLEIAFEVLGVEDSFGRFEPFSEAEIDELVKLEKFEKSARIVLSNNDWYGGAKKFYPELPGDMSYEQVRKFVDSKVDELNAACKSRWAQKFRTR